MRLLIRCLPFAQCLTPEVERSLGHQALERLVNRPIPLSATAVSVRQVAGLTLCVCAPVLADTVFCIAATRACPTSPAYLAVVPPIPLSTAAISVRQVTGFAFCVGSPVLADTVCCMAAAGLA